MDESNEKEVLPSRESALQLREAINEMKGALDRFLDEDRISELPRRAKQFVEADVRYEAARAVVLNEGVVYLIPHQARRSVVTTRG